MYWPSFVDVVCTVWKVILYGYYTNYDPAVLQTIALWIASTLTRPTTKRSSSWSRYAWGRAVYRPNCSWSRYAWGRAVYRPNCVQPTLCSAEWRFTPCRHLRPSSSGREHTVITCSGKRQRGPSIVSRTAVFQQTSEIPLGQWKQVTGDNSYVFTATFYLEFYMKPDSGSRRAEGMLRAR